MKKLKWNYDKKFKQWWIPNAGGGFTIVKEGTKYSLSQYHVVKFYFTKLSSAKKVAQLIYNG